MLLSALHTSDCTCITGSRVYSIVCIIQHMRTCAITYLGFYVFLSYQQPRARRSGHVVINEDYVLTGIVTHWAQRIHICEAHPLRSFPRQRAA